MKVATQLLKDAVDGTLPTSKSSSSLTNSVASQPFGELMQQAVSSLQQVEEDASSKVKGLLSGDGTDIHTALIATQKASLAFDMALAVRNKALGAYQQVMSMQF